MLRHLAAHRRTLHAVPLQLGGVTVTTDESSPVYKLRLHGAHRRLRTIPALRDQDCTHSTLSRKPRLNFTVSVGTMHARMLPAIVVRAARRWEHWHASRRDGSGAQTATRKNASGQPAHVRTMVPSPSKEQRGSTEGVCLLRRIRQTDRHVGSNSERWSGHTRDRKRQRPAPNAGARPRVRWKDVNRAAPNIWQETQSQRKSGRSSAANGDNGLMDTELHHELLS